MDGYINEGLNQTFYSSEFQQGMLFGTRIDDSYTSHWRCTQTHCTCAILQEG